jgi:hypothetical protein
LYQAAVIIHKSPWSATDPKNYFVALLGYDEAYTLVSGVVSMLMVGML